MVLRQYLCNPRSAIINTTSILRRKRHEFINAISDGSISLESTQSIPQNTTKPKLNTMSQKHINATAKVNSQELLIIFILVVHTFKFNK